MYFILLAEKKSWRMLERNILGANVFFRVFDCGLFRLGSRFGGGWHGDSCRAPFLSFQTRLVAIEKEQTFTPEGRERSSGSRVRFPIMIALFKYMAIS